MNFVQPLRDKNDIENIKQVLRKQSTRNYMLFLIGINIGMRISDLIILQKKHIKGKCENFRVKEKKTGKINIYVIPTSIKEELAKYVEHMEITDYLFPSPYKYNAPITPRQAYNIIHNSAQQVGVKENIGTHSLRKTFGYWFYKNTGDIVMLQMIFGHSDVDITRRYIGLTDNKINAVVKKFSL